MQQQMNDEKEKPNKWFQYNQKIMLVNCSGKVWLFSFIGKKSQFSPKQKFGYKIQYKMMVMWDLTCRWQLMMTTIDDDDNVSVIIKNQTLKPELKCCLGCCYGANLQM